MVKDWDIRILNGCYEAYISHAKKNYKIPKDIIPADITLEQAKEIVAGKPSERRRKTKQ